MSEEHDRFFGCGCDAPACDRIGFPGSCCSACGKARGPRHAFRGDTITFVVQVLQSDLPLTDDRGNPLPAAPQDLTGWTVWCTAKRQVPDYDGQAVAQACTAPGSFPAGAGVVLTVPTQGLARVTFPPIATRGFPDSPVHLVVDVQLQDPAGRVFTPRAQRGYLVVEPDVTRAP